MKKILVTGANGLVGSTMVKLLVCNGYMVNAMLRNKTELRSLESISTKITVVEADLLDYESLLRVLNECELVIHTAAIVSFSNKLQNQVIKNNQKGTENLVNAMLELKIPYLLHVSSVAALSADNNTYITEVANWSSKTKHSAYALSKHLAEMEVWRGFAEGLNGNIVNPSIILGKGANSKGSGAFLHLAMNEFPFCTIGVNGWVGVDDVAKSILLLMESSFNHQRYIVSEGNYSYFEIMNMLAKALDKKPPKYILHKNAMRLAVLVAKIWGWVTLSDPLISKDAARNSLATSYYDNSKLKQHLGFTYTPINEVIQSLINK